MLATIKNSPSIEVIMEPLPTLTISKNLCAVLDLWLTLWQKGLWCMCYRVLYISRKKRYRVISWLRGHRKIKGHHIRVELPCQLLGENKFASINSGEQRHRHFRYIPRLPLTPTLSLHAISCAFSSVCKSHQVFRVRIPANASC